MAAVGLVTALVGAPRPATACETVVIAAALSDDLRRIDGTATCLLAESTTAPTAVATFPRTLRQPLGLDDVSRAWHYPSGFDAADLSLALCADDDCRTRHALSGDGAWQGLPPPTTASLRLHFATTIPRRSGSFGRHRESVYLLGGWHPAFGDGAHLPRREIHYRVSLPADRVGFIADRRVPRSAHRQVMRGSFHGRYLPLFLTRAASLDRAGASVILTPQPILRHDLKQDTGDNLRDVTAHLDETAREHLAETLVVGQAAARRHGIPIRQLVILRGPIQENLVEPFDGGLLIADRAFHLSPLERMMKFHRLPVWRNQLAAYLVPWIERREEQLHEGLTPDLIADAIAAALRDRLRRQRYGDRESAADLLEWFAFIPEIDALVFAPQVAFSDAYYEAIDETPAVRRRLDDFFHTRPRGKLLYEKLSDALGEVETGRLFDRYLAGEANWLTILATNDAGRDPWALIAPWLGPYPVIDYALGEIRTTSDGEIEVEIEARGPDADRVREPITVAIEDDEGEVHRVTREGPGRVRVRAPGPADTVRLDPDGRLVEHHRTPGEAPRFNNRDPARWRFLLNNITGLFAVTNGEIHAAIDFSLRRIHDLTWAVQFWGVYQPDAYGAGSSLSYAFGPEVTPLRLAHRISLSPAYLRLTTSDDTFVGDQVSLGLAYTYDNRRIEYWSYEGEGLRVRIIPALAWDGDQLYPYAQIGAAALKIFPIAFGHAFVTRVSADFEVGDSPPEKGLVLGHRYRGGRGFEYDEVRGTRRIIASGEYRHVFSADGRTDFFGLVTFTRLEGALFGDIINLPVDRDGCTQQMFYDVGYGLRFVGDVLNVAPASVQIDFGVPLNRCPDEDDRWPVTIWVAISQSFATF